MVTCKNVTFFFLFLVNPSLFLKFQFNYQKFYKIKGIFGASAMSWMELFEPIVNGLSFLD